MGEVLMVGGVELNLLLEVSTLRKAVTSIGDPGLSLLPLLGELVMLRTSLDTWRTSLSSLVYSENVVRHIGVEVGREVVGTVSGGLGVVEEGVMGEEGIVGPLGLVI